jgi:hypothetical protein
VGNDDYRAELIYDLGVTDRVTWTINASADYKDRKNAIDSRGGRAATEFLGQLTAPELTQFGRTSITLSFSVEAKWMTAQRPQYTAQSKLSIPVAPGVDLPIVYRWANRRDLIDNESSEARMGLSVDVGRLAQVFRQ